MKCVKTLGSSAIVAVAFVAFIGTNTASGTVLCKKQGEAGSGGTGTTCPSGFAYAAETKLHARATSLEEPVILELDSLKLECPESTIQGKTSGEGGEGLGVSIAVEVLTFLECPHCEFRVLKAGTVTISWISGTHAGTVTSNGTEMTWSCFIPGVGTDHCIYRTENTHLGAIAGGTQATLEVETSIPAVPTGLFCSEAMAWEGTYTVTEPSALYVAEKT
ncbi:MAG TPA: hypothetical protein VFJ65_03380 [Solirubrobacterales bacterium]|nr:hypothetical protein [Solirubrobacterales bacterium]